MANVAEQLPEPMDADTFLAWVQGLRGPEKWQLLDGVAVAMAGGTMVHDTIAMNLLFALSDPVKRRGCRLQRDVYIRSPVNSDFLAIPDLFVRCGPVRDNQTTIDNPLAIVEVLSPSTMLNDRGYKLQEYLRIDSVTFIALVYPREVRLEVWAREPGAEWPDEPAVLRTIDAVLVLPGLDAAVSLADIYEGVTGLLPAD